MNADPAAPTAIADAYVEHGSDLLDRDENDKAAAQFAVAIGRDPASREAVAAAYVKRGQALLELDRIEPAEALFKLATGHVDKVKIAVARAYVDYGRLMLLRGETDRARQQFAVALSLDPSSSARIDEAWTRRPPQRMSIAAVAWHPDDKKTIDYRHLDHALAGSTFNLTAADIELLIKANHFAPVAMGGKILFALRGAMLVDGPAQVGKDVIRIRDARPDHRTFRSVVGVFDLVSRKISAFIGETVPNRSYVYLCWQRARDGEDLAGNLLPTGSYGYIVGRLNTTAGAFVLRVSTEEKRTVAVLRSTDDVTYDIQDEFDVAQPGDNIHPAYSASTAEFSSAGDITVRGNSSGGHNGEWAQFRVAAGLPADAPGPYGTRIDLVMVTGLEAAIAASLREKGKASDAAVVREKLERLRQGSKGPLVVKLREKLALPAGDEFDAYVVEALANLQRKRLDWNDGILGPETDKALGLCVFGEG